MIWHLALAVTILSHSTSVQVVSAKDPNIVIVMTDEHNYKTLGYYRDQLSNDQAFIWGDDIKVTTPNINSIAQDGALYTHFFASSPMCTPSRASFLTGLYPPATGAAENHAAMNSNLVTFAQVLTDSGWDTGFVGKFHLNGRILPGWSAEGESVFGYTSTKYLYNRGHCKYKLLDCKFNNTKETYYSLNVCLMNGLTPQSNSLMKKMAKIPGMIGPKRVNRNLQV